MGVHLYLNVNFLVGMKVGQTTQSVVAKQKSCLVKTE
jgi:hypothetical protein